jgi:predicted RNA-binding Zn ribbon-like protein
MTEKITVQVEPIADYPAILMKWERKGEVAHIRQAYRKISELLDNSTTKLYVVVDLRENIGMPLKETISGALFGPYNHPKLIAWLVMGGHPLAKAVANTLRAVTQKQRVEWFDTEKAVYARLEAAKWDALA